MKRERHRLTGNVGLSTAYWFSILKSLKSFMQLNLILQFLYLANKFQDSILILDQSSPWNCVECWALKSLQFFHFIEASLMSFTKFSILFWALCMKKLLISTTLFVPLMSTINLTSLRLDNSLQFWDLSSVIIGLELVFLNLCSMISENCSLCRSRRILICSLSELWLGIYLTFGICESNGFTTGLSNWLTDDDWLDDKPSSWEWKDRLRLASFSRSWVNSGEESALPIVTSSYSKSFVDPFSTEHSWMYGSVVSEMW